MLGEGSGWDAREKAAIEGSGSGNGSSEGSSGCLRSDAFGQRHHSNTAINNKDTDHVLGYAGIGR